MTRLALTLSTSPDPAMLEIRILTNHGNDERFSFLRKGGQWRALWEELRKPPVAPVVAISSGMGLGDYGSDSEEESPVDVDEAVDKQDDSSESSAALEKQRIKARKVQAWASKRKAAREQQQQGPASS